MCFPLVLCMSESVCVRVGGERDTETERERESENTAVHAMNTLCDTCQSQGCWVKKGRRERGKEKKILCISLISSSSQSLPPPSRHLTQLPIQPVCVSVCLYLALWLQYHLPLSMLFSFALSFFSHSLISCLSLFQNFLVFYHN